MWIEQGAGQGQGVKDFRPSSQLFQIHGAERDCCFSQCLCNGRE
jgi:hypothetical protein